MAEGLTFEHSPLMLSHLTPRTRSQVVREQEARELWLDSYNIKHSSRTPCTLGLIISSKPWGAHPQKRREVVRSAGGAEVVAARLQGHALDQRALAD